MTDSRLFNQAVEVAVDPLQDSRLFNQAVEVAVDPTQDSRLFNQSVEVAVDPLQESRLFNQAVEVAVPVSPYYTAVMADSPIGYWRMEDSAANFTVIDYSGRNHNGTRNSTSNSYVTSKDGLEQAIRFTQDAGGTAARVDVGSGSIWTGLTAMSLELWTKLSANPPSTKHLFAADNTGSSRNWGFEMGSDGKLQFIVFTASGNPSCFTPNSICDNAWHHVVGTYDGTNLRLYLDGTLVSGPTALTGTVKSLASGTYIGYREFAPGDSIGADIDEVAIYDTALSPTRVAAHFNALAPPSFAALYAQDVNVIAASDQVTLYGQEVAIVEASNQVALHGQSVQVVMQALPPPSANFVRTRGLVANKTFFLSGVNSSADMVRTRSLVTDVDVGPAPRARTYVRMHDGTLVVVASKFRDVLDVLVLGQTDPIPEGTPVGTVILRTVD